MIIGVQIGRPQVAPTMRNLRHQLEIYFIRKVKTMSLINISNLTFAYDGSYDNIFDNVSFQIDTDWKLGFTGRNGRGKTTFLNLLLGKYEYTGKITSAVNFIYFPFEVSDKTADTVQVVQNICPNYQHWELLREFTLLQVSQDVLYRPYSTLSNGEQTKVMLAILFLKENSFLLIDEPTNHLDMKAREIVCNYLRSKHGYILVSHDRNFIDNCIDHILSINKSNIEIQNGNFSSWLLNKDMQDNFELAKNAKLKKEIKRLSATAREKSDWSDKVEASKIGSHQGDRGRIGHMAAKMMKRSKSIEKRKEREVDEKSKLLKNIETSDKIKITSLSYHSNRLVSLRDVSLFYGNKLVCDNVNFSVEQGDRIALCGKNGSGKSSIIKLICDENIEYRGDFQKGRGIKISYITQDTSFLSGNLKDFALQNKIDEVLFKAILRKLDFQRVQFEKDIRDFSAGQKKKVLIAKSLCENAHLYIWDEPLNYIDVISRIQVEELILQYKPTLIFVEHDSAFVENISTKKVDIYSTIGE